MKNTKVLLAVLSTLFLAGCPDNVEPVLDEAQGPQDVEACSGVPIPGAELYLERTTGAPNTASMELPALTAVCLKVESNTASGWVELDGTDMFGPSDFKNTEVALHRVVEGMVPEHHTVTAEIASKPGNYMKVTAYYPMGGLANGSEMNSVDEALFLGQAFIEYHSHLSTFSSWAGGTAAQAIPLENFAGEIEAYEIAVEDPQGNEAGYLVLETNELRPILGAAWGKGSSLSKNLLEKYYDLYQEDPTQNTFRYLWAGFGIMGLEVVLDDQVRRLVLTCEDDECPGVSFDGFDRPVANYQAAGLTADEYVAQRREYVELMVGAMLIGAGEENVSSDYDKTIGFFGVPKNSGTTATASTGDPVFLEPNDPEVQAACEPPRYPRERYVPGEYSQDELALISSLHQTKDTWNGEPSCSAGCVPIAATILLNYWDRRYEFLIEGSENDSVSDAGIHDATEQIRDVLETSCDDDNLGQTPSVNISTRLDTFVDQRAGMDVGWTYDYPLVGGESATVRQDQFWPQIERGHPPVIHYFVSTTDNPEPDSDTNTNHAGVAYGYIDDGRRDLLSDWVVLAKGWRSQPIQVLPSDADGGVKMTRVTPGCRIPGSPSDPCMTFSDITPGLSWGKESVETLSCMCVMRGQPDGRFLPNDSITKAEFIKTVVKLAYPGPQSDLDGIEETPLLAGFCSDHWAAGYINFAYNKGMLGWPIVGSPAYLAVDAPITREEAAYLLVMAGLQSAVPTFQHLHAISQCTQNAENPYKSYDQGMDLVQEAIDPTFLPYILATTSDCVFEGFKLDTNDDDPLTPREFRGWEHISRIGAAKVGCIARFGADSDKCSLGYTCQPLTTVSCP